MYRTVQYPISQLALYTSLLVALNFNMNLSFVLHFYILLFEIETVLFTCSTELNLPLVYTV